MKPGIEISPTTGTKSHLRGTNPAKAGFCALCSRRFNVRAKCAIVKHLIWNCCLSKKDLTGFENL
jgi:hypothetical protein